ncbi:MAG: hypothetical protein HC851_08765 [Acaryochloris sp. RU_4_1]|nr:hypothetical protein [Acaryochloris sp. RU_4_1]NJR53650.1 hypothetical protein [Acaryochloris sp. CRU_2_0]
MVAEPVLAFAAAASRSGEAERREEYERVEEWCLTALAQSTGRTPTTRRANS